FFFQAEDGIRDLTVTGVQTCALPILMGLRQGLSMLTGALVLWLVIGPHVMDSGIGLSIVQASVAPENLAHCQQLAGAWRPSLPRSEERRVGKEGRGRRSACAARGDRK